MHICAIVTLWIFERKTPQPKPAGRPQKLVDFSHTLCAGSTSTGRRAPRIVPPQPERPGHKHNLHDRATVLTFLCVGPLLLCTEGLGDASFLSAYSDDTGPFMLLLLW